MEKTLGKRLKNKAKILAKILAKYVANSIIPRTCIQRVGHLRRDCLRITLRFHRLNAEVIFPLMNFRKIKLFFVATSVQERPFVLRQVSIIENFRLQVHK